MVNIREAHGLKWVDGGPETDDHLAFSGHEEGLRPILESYLPADGVFLDVGAHVGLWTLTEAARGCRVYAFEANRPTLDTLVRNLALNDEATGWSKGRVKVFRQAVWDEHDKLSARDWFGKTTGGSTAYTADTQGTIPAETLDYLLGHSEPFPDRIDLIKIDTEGAEARVLRGATDTLKTYRPTILAEMHGGTQDIPTYVDEEVYEVLQKANYEIVSEFDLTGRRIVARPAEVQGEDEQYAYIDR